MIDKIIGKLCIKINNYADRYKVYLNNKSIGINNGRLGRECKLRYPNNIEVGYNTYINGGYLFASTNSKIKIGRNCLISYNVHMRTDMHNYIDICSNINTQGSVEKDIIIKDDVWIGFGAQIMAGVTVSEGCVIAAGAVVTKDTEPYSVYAGVPAKLIKKRKDINMEEINND